jgi:hypothetical protein
LPGVVALVLQLASLLAVAGGAAGTAPYGPVSGDVARTPAIAAAIRTDLAHRLGLDPGGITLVLFEQVTWSDSCLGIHLPGSICAQSLEPGFLAVVTGGDRVYRYHGSGRVFVAADFVPGATVSEPVPGIGPARSAIRVIAVESRQAGPPGRGLIP